MEINVETYSTKARLPIGVYFGACVDWYAGLVNKIIASKGWSRKLMWPSASGNAADNLDFLVIKSGGFFYCASCELTQNFPALTAFYDFTLFVQFFAVPNETRADGHGTENFEHIKLGNKKFACTFVLGEVNFDLLTTRC
jgi:hypothetical protein